MFRVQYNQPFGLFLFSQNAYIQTPPFTQSSQSVPYVAVFGVGRKPAPPSCFVFSNTPDSPADASGPVDLSDPNLTLYDVTFPSEYIMVGVDPLEALVDNNLMFNAGAGCKVVDWNGNPFSSANPYLCPLLEIGFSYNGGDFLQVNDLWTAGQADAKVVVVPYYMADPAVPGVENAIIWSCVNGTCQDISSSIDGSVYPGWGFPLKPVSVFGPSSFNGFKIYNDQVDCQNGCLIRPPPVSPASPGYKIQYNQPFVLYMPAVKSIIYCSDTLNAPAALSPYTFLTNSVEDTSQNVSFFVFSNDPLYPSDSTGTVDLSDPNLTLYDVSFDKYSSYFPVGTKDWTTTTTGVGSQLVFNSLEKCAIVDWSGAPFQAARSTLCPLLQIALMQVDGFAQLADTHSGQVQPAKFLALPINIFPNPDAPVKNATVIGCVDNICRDISNNIGEPGDLGWQMPSNGSTTCSATVYGGYRVFNSMADCKSQCMQEPPPKPPVNPPVNPPSHRENMKKLWLSILLGASVLVIVVISILVILVTTQRRR